MQYSNSWLKNLLSIIKMIISSKLDLTANFSTSLHIVLVFNGTRAVFRNLNVMNSLRKKMKCQQFLDAEINLCRE